MSISKQIDQASHGEHLCLVDGGGNVIARTPSGLAIDHLTADQLVLRWNAHNALVEALESIAEDKAVYAPELQRVARAALAKVQS